MARGRKERRRHIFGYTTLGSLYEHFESRLPREEMISTVREALSCFIPRDGSSPEDMRLQMVKKCELGLRDAADRLERQGELAQA